MGWHSRRNPAVLPTTRTRPAPARSHYEAFQHTDTSRHHWPESAARFPQSHTTNTTGLRGKWEEAARDLQACLFPAHCPAALLTQSAAQASPRELRPRDAQACGSSSQPPPLTVRNRKRKELTHTIGPNQPPDFRNPTPQTPQARISRPISAIPHGGAMEEHALLYCFLIFVELVSTRAVPLIKTNM
jgi:hypothetical protein